MTNDKIVDINVNTHKRTKKVNIEISKSQLWISAPITETSIEKKRLLKMWNKEWDGMGKF